MQKTLEYLTQFQTFAIDVGLVDISTTLNTPTDDQFSKGVSFMWTFYLPNLEI